MYPRVTIVHTSSCVQLPEPLASQGKNTKWYFAFSWNFIFSPLEKWITHQISSGCNLITHPWNLTALDENWKWTSHVYWAAGEPGNNVGKCLTLFRVSVVQNLSFKEVDFTFHQSIIWAKIMQSQIFWRILKYVL